MKLTLKNFWAYVVIGLAIFLGVVTLFDGYMDIKIDRKLSKPEILNLPYLGEVKITNEDGVEVWHITLDEGYTVSQPNAYQDFLIEALKTNRSPECNLLFDDCLGLMGIEK